MVNTWFEMLELKKSGMKNKEIAEKYQLSPSRVSHILSILGKAEQYLLEKHQIKE